MNFSTIATTWAQLKKTAQILIVTEAERLHLAKRLKADNLPYAARVRIIDITKDNACDQAMGRLSEEDLMIVLLTADSFVRKGFGRLFPPFSKPAGFAGKYIFMRLDIPEASLLSGLNTSLEKVEAVIRTYQALNAGEKVRVTTDKGTDITMQIDFQELLPYQACALGGNAFLPPAEISEELVAGSANGVIIVDTTVGELRFGAELIDPLGIVDEQVKLTVQKGLVTDISGGETARRLKAGLDKLDPGLKMLVELGHGLSDMAPTGLIGVDESMNGTCHFGIGNRNPYHVDVVVSDPHIMVISQS